MLILPKELLDKTISKEIRGIILSINNNILRIKSKFNVEVIDLNEGLFFAYVKGYANKINNLIGKEITVLEYQNYNLPKTRLTRDRSFYFVRNSNLTYLVCKDKLESKGRDYVTDDDLFNY